MNDILTKGASLECATCGHEWTLEDTSDGEERVVKDANGNVLQTGDSVTLIKSLKLKGGGATLKSGTKVKNIRIVDGDHELDCKVDGQGIMLKACFVKKA